MIASYFKAQLKRTAKLSVVVFPISLLLFVSLGLAAALFLTQGPFTENKSRYRIAIVGDLEDSYLGFGIRAIQSLDDSRFVVDFQSMSMDEAESALRRGEVISIFKIPDDFLESVLYGRNDVSITYITGTSQKTVGGFLIDAFADMTSDLIISSQAAIYGVQDLLMDMDYDAGEFRRISDHLYLELAGIVMSRTALAEVEELGYVEGTGALTWYFYTILLFFCFLFGMSSAGVFLLRNPSLPKWMCVRGIGAGVQILCEYLIYLLLMLVCTILPLVMMSGVLTTIAPSVSLPSLSALVPALLPVILLTAALQFTLYEVIKSPVAVILLQFFLAVGMGYLSGYFFPPGFFPETLRVIGRILPTGVALTWLFDTMENSLPAGAAAGIAVYILGSLMTTTLCRRRSILSGGAL